MEIRKILMPDTNASVIYVDEGGSEWETTLIAVAEDGTTLTVERPKDSQRWQLSRQNQPGTRNLSLAAEALRNGGTKLKNLEPFEFSEPENGTGPKALIEALQQSLKEPQNWEIVSPEPDATPETREMVKQIDEICSNIDNATRGVSYYSASQVALLRFKGELLNQRMKLNALEV